MVTKASRTPLYSYLRQRDYEKGAVPSAWLHIGVIDDSLLDTVTHDGPVPNYKSLIQQGLSATTYLTGQRHDATLSNDGYAIAEMYYEPLGITGVVEVEGNWMINMPGPVDPSSITISSVRNQVITKFNSRATAALTSLKGLVSAGELGETLRMVNGAGKALFGKTQSHLTDLSKLAGRLTPQNLKRTISARWLEYSFGVKPLINDIDDGLKGLSRIRDFRPPRQRVSAKGESSEISQVTTEQAVYNRFSVKNVYERRARYGYKLYGAVGIPNFGLNDFSHEFGWTPSEFLPTVYELIPYSFLVDYFSNLGSIIEGFSFNRSSLCWVAEGELQSSDCSSAKPEISFVVPNGWTKVYDSIRTGTLNRQSRTIVARRPYLGTFIPSLEFKIPGTETKWINIAALGAQHTRVSRRLRGV